MLQILFSPTGKIGPHAFMKGVVVLIAISAVLGVLPLLSFEIGSVFKILMLVLIWCWIVLFVKRFRFAGKSGWMCLLPIIVYVIAYFIYTSIVQRMFAPDLIATMEELTIDAMENGDWGGMMQISSEYAKPIAEKTALPLAIAGALVSYAIAFGTNFLLRGARKS